MMDVLRSKKRSPNFTETEKHVLFDIVVVGNYLNIVENKRTDGVTTAKKKVAWDEITQQYNCKATSGTRTAVQLHALYDMLKRNARRNLLIDRKNMFKIGDGTYVRKSTSLDEKVVAIFKFQLEPQLDHYDSSSEDSLTIIKNEIIEENDDTNFIYENNQEEGKTHDNEAFSMPASSPFPESSGFLVGKRAYDDELFEQKKKILQIEVDIKRKQLEIITQQLENARKLFEIDFEIKKKELELREIECENKKSKLQ